jgi:hypothetical protein
MLTPEKMLPFVRVRGMARTTVDRRRRSLGQDRAGRCAEAHRPWARWVAAWPAVGGLAGGGRLEVEKKGLYG